MPYIHEFSSGYYLINGLFIEASSSVSVPKIHDYLYAELQDNYYKQSKAPILFRHISGNSHFRVEPSSTVGPDIMQVPKSIVETFDAIETVGTDQFLISKPTHAQTIVDMSPMQINTIDTR